MRIIPILIITGALALFGTDIVATHDCMLGKDDGDKLHYRASMLANGKQTEAPDFKLTRQRKNAQN